MERIGERVAARRARAVPAFFAPAGVGEVARAGMVDGFGTVAREVEGR